MYILKKLDKITLKYVDSQMNIYKYDIIKDDCFLVNFCRNDFTKMEKLLKNYKIIENGDSYIFRVEEPIFLEYTLRKDETIIKEMFQSFKDKVFLFEIENEKLRENVKKLEEKLEYYEKKLERIAMIDRGDCIIFPKYNEIIPINLKEFYYELDKGEIDDFSILGKCLNLEKIVIVGNKSVKKIDLSNFKLLNSLTLKACENLSNLVLENKNIKFMELWYLNKLKILDLSRCCSLINLEISYCDRLEKINLIGCENIQSLFISYCLNLRKIYFSNLEKLSLVKIFFCKTLSQDQKERLSRNMEKIQ